MLISDVMLIRVSESEEHRSSTDLDESFPQVEIVLLLLNHVHRVHRRTTISSTVLETALATAIESNFFFYHRVSAEGDRFLQ